MHVGDVDERHLHRDPHDAVETDPPADRVEQDGPDDRADRREDDRQDQAELTATGGEAGQGQDELAGDRGEDVVEEDKEPDADGTEGLHDAHCPGGEAAEVLRGAGGDGVDEQSGRGESGGVRHGQRPCLPLTERSQRLVWEQTPHRTSTQ